MAVHAVRVAWPSFGTITTEWNQEIVTSPGRRSVVTSGNSLSLFDGNVYVVGYGDVDKEPSPSGGGYWQSGLAASLTPSGNVRWVTLVALTAHGEYLHGLFVTPDGVYGVGRGAEYQTVSGLNAFGYAWMCKIALDTGEVASNMLFGNDSYQSAFFDVFVTGTTAYCVGNTQQVVPGGVTKSWWVEVDVSSPLAARTQDLMHESGGGYVDARTLAPDFP